MENESELFVISKQKIKNVIGDTFSQGAIHYIFEEFNRPTPAFSAPLRQILRNWTLGLFRSFLVMTWVDIDGVNSQTKLLSHM